MNIKNGWLDKEENVEAILKDGRPTSHFYSLYSDKPLGVCWHYSNPVWSSLSSAKEVCELLLKEEASASWHGMISKAGTFYQCISFNKGSSTPPLKKNVTWAYFSVFLLSLLPDIYSGKQ